MLTKYVHLLHVTVHSTRINECAQHTEITSSNNNMTYTYEQHT